MKIKKEDKELFIKAQIKVRRIRMFYLHFALYIIVVALLMYNFYIVAGPYKNNIISLNLSVLVAWTVFIIVHGLTVFKGKQIFNKSWEDKKIKKFLNEEEDVERTFWE